MLASAYQGDDGTRFVRAWLYRLVWWVVQPAVLRATRLSGSGERIVHRSERRARDLLSALTGRQLSALRR